jgi:hypothetical protein
VNAKTKESGKSAKALPPKPAATVHKGPTKAAKHPAKPAAKHPAKPKKAAPKKAKAKKR